MRSLRLPAAGIGFFVAIASGCGSDDGTGRTINASVSVSERT